MHALCGQLEIHMKTDVCINCRLKNRLIPGVSSNYRQHGVQITVGYNKFCYDLKSGAENKNRLWPRNVLRDRISAL